MSVLRDKSSVSASARTDFDRRALGVVADVLTTGIWLEHRLRVTPTPRATVAQCFGWVRAPLSQLRSVGSPFAQPAREQALRPARPAAIRQ
jgi:hypothetical protein